MKYILVGFVLLGLFGMAQSLQQEEEKEKINFLIKMMYDDLFKEDSFSKSTFAFRIKSYQSNTFNNTDNFNYFREKLIKIFPLYVGEESKVKSERAKPSTDTIKIQRKENKLKIKKSLASKAIQNEVVDVFSKVQGYGASHLIDVYFDFYDEKFRLDIYVYEVKTRILVWNDSWKVRSSHYLGYVGLKTYLDEVDKYTDNIKITHALSMGIGSDSVGYADLLFLIDPNFTYQDHSSGKGLDVAFGLNCGFQSGFNLFALADYWNDEVNLYFVIRSMLGFRYFVKQVDQNGKAFQLNLDIDLGVMFAIRESSFYFEVGINPLDVSPYFIIGSRN